MTVISPKEVEARLAQFADVGIPGVACMSADQDPTIIARLLRQAQQIEISVSVKGKPAMPFERNMKPERKHKPRNIKAFGIFG